MKEVKKKEANMNLGDLVYNDPSTMERLVKIVEALWNGTAKLGQLPRPMANALEVGACKSSN